MYSQQNNNNFINAIDIAAFIIGVMNMVQNRQQTEQNDVNAANDKQARYLIEELGKKFDEQNEMLADILSALKNH